MAARRRYYVTSAQEIDPLSWFTGPYLPLAFSGLVVVAGGAITAATWSVSARPWLQLAGLLLCALAGLLIFARTRPLQPPVSWGTGALALATALTGLVISAFDYAGTELNLGLWWAPAGVALTLASLAPYVAARKVFVLGTIATALCVALGFGILYPVDPFVGPVATSIIIGAAPAMAVASTWTFSYSIVSTMVPMLESPSRIMVAGQEVRDAAAVEIERVTLARLTARAAPFLEGIAEAARITPEDRALAGQLARRLRDDLVTQSNVSWLDSVASDSRLVVVDPDRLAKRMNNAQRTALRGLLGAILELPETDHGSVMIDLRKAPDGATAVGLSLDMALPEGRRIMHIAPYYLTLKTAVDDLSVSADGITFRIAAEGGPPANIR